MKNECTYKLIEPKEVPISNHDVHDWALRLCVFSSIACSFGFALDSEAEQSIISESHCIQVSTCTDLSDQKALVSELNKNAEIKERIVSRILNFKDELKEGWNGNAELPMEALSVENALAAVNATPSEEFEKWTVFPSSNGTILFSPIDNFIAGISIGNDEFSYAAIGLAGQEIKGKESFSVKSFKLAISLINSFNQA